MQPTASPPSPWPSPSPPEASPLSTSPRNRTWPGDAPSTAEAAERRRVAPFREYRVTPADLTPAVGPCRSCGAPTASVSYDHRPLGDRPGTFAGLPPEWLPALQPDRFAGLGRHGRSGLDCPRCRWLAAAAGVAALYSSLKPRWVDGHVGAQRMATAWFNRMMDDFADAPDALFPVGQLVVTPAASGPDWQRRDRVAAHVVAALHRHQRGDHGTLGLHVPASEPDRRRGPLLAPRPASSAMAIEDGKGEVLSRYPIEPAPSPFGHARPRARALLAWTVLVPGEAGFTLVSLSTDVAGPSGEAAPATLPAAG